VVRTDLDINTKYVQADSSSTRLFEQAARVLPGGTTPTTVHRAPDPR
jgi:hypothetical protein